MGAPATAQLQHFALLRPPAGVPHPHPLLLPLHLPQDVPGVAYGTIPNRADGTLLRIIPKSERGRPACCQLHQNKPEP